MNVLSLFDGISCGQIALNKLNIKVDNYFASEIELNAIKVTQHNYHDTVQIGDVRDISYNDGKLYKKNELIFEGKIDLLIGGSPCTNFSIAGKKYGIVTEETNIEILDLETYIKLKEEGFTFKGQSFLFWEYVRLLKEVKPTYFLLENVNMTKKWENIISKALGVQPIKINSSLVSAQDRKRLYWTNISDVEQPEDKEIYLLNILDTKFDSKLYLNDSTVSRFKRNDNKEYINNKSCVIGRLSDHQGDRVFDIACKGSSLSAGGGNNGGGGCNIIFDPSTHKLRRLSINECERLQTVPDNYTGTSPVTSRYKMLGNGWTVDVIAHIFSFMIDE
jgi:DNA (cytosine-5)-methyltransferase 3A